MGVWEEEAFLGVLDAVCSMPDARLLRNFTRGDDDDVAVDDEPRLEGKAGGRGGASCRTTFDAKLVLIKPHAEDLA